MALEQRGMQAELWGGSLRLRLPEQLELHRLALGVACSSSSGQLLQVQRVTIGRSAEAAGAAASGEEPLGDGKRMAEEKARRDAYRATVAYRLGIAAGAGIKWKRTTVPTLDSDGVIRGFAVRSGAQIDAWLVDDAGETELERCQGRWRPAVRGLAAAPGDVGQVPSMEESLAAFV